MKHLALTLLLIGCGGDPFSAESAASDGAIPDSGAPSIVRSSDDAGRGGTSSGGSGGEDVAGGAGGSVAGTGGIGGALDEDAGVAGGVGASGGAGAGGTSISGAAGLGGTGGVGECAVGEMRCSGAQPQVCVGAEWFDSAACSGTTPVCLSGRCVECVPGDQACTNPNQPSVCGADGFFAPSGSACSGFTPQCLDNQCIACDPDTVQAGGYCPSCPNTSPCCKSTLGGGCGCPSFEGCR